MAIEQLRGLESLVRTELRVREAVDELAAKRFDLATARLLRTRVEELLDAVALLAADDDLWERLTSKSAAPPTDSQLATIRHAASSGFASLLTLAGYKSPPPPDVDSLVGDTFEALAAALESPLYDKGASAERARWYLRTLVWRVRRQVSDPNILREEKKLLTAAVSIGKAARALIPPIVSAATVVAVEAVIPTGGTASVLVVKLLADLVGLVMAHAAEIVVNQLAPQVPETADAEVEVSWEQIDPIAIHLSAAEWLLSSARVLTKHPGDGGSAEAIALLLEEAHAHLSRIEALRSEHPIFLSDRQYDLLRQLEEDYEFHRPARVDQFRWHLIEDDAASAPTDHAHAPSSAIGASMAEEKKEPPKTAYF